MQFTAVREIIAEGPTPEDAVQAWAWAAKWSGWEVPPGAGVRIGENDNEDGWKATGVVIFPYDDTPSWIPDTVKPHIIKGGPQ